MMREKKNGAYIDYLITVNDSIAAILEKYFNLKNKPIVTRNIPRFKEVSKQNKSLRIKFNIPDEDTVVVFIGINVYPYTNKMENFIAAIANKPNMHLIIITQRNERRLWFEDYVKSNSINNIYFHDIIPADEIEEYIACCDIGLVTSWYKKKLSYWLALDNKLFTYIMSELPLLGTAQPEFENIILKYNVGVCINPDTIEAIEDGLQELIRNKEKYIAQCRLAKKELCWEKEQSALINLYQQLIAKHSAIQ
jgi:glycosyltransferase involved in cell wall biosynthesis